MKSQERNSLLLQKQAAAEQPFRQDSGNSSSQPTEYQLIMKDTHPQQQKMANDTSEMTEKQREAFRASGFILDEKSSISIHNGPQRGRQQRETQKVLMDVGLVQKSDEIIRIQDSYHGGGTTLDQKQEQPADYGLRDALRSSEISAWEQHGSIGRPGQQVARTIIVKDEVRGSKEEFSSSPIKYKEQPPRVQTSVPQQHRGGGQQNRPLQFVSYQAYPQNAAGLGGSFDGNPMQINAVNSSDCSLDYQTITTMQQVHQSLHIYEQQRRRRRNILSKHEQTDERPVIDDLHLTMQTEEPNFMIIGRGLESAFRRPETRGTAKVLLDTQNSNERNVLSITSNYPLSNKQSFKQLVSVTPTPPILHEEKVEQVTSEVLVTFNNTQLPSEGSRLHTPAIGAGDGSSQKHILQDRESLQELLNESQASYLLNEFTLGKEIMQQSDDQRLREMPVFDLLNSQSVNLNGTFKPNSVSNHTIAEESKESLDVGDQHEILQDQPYFSPTTKPLKLSVSKKQLELQRVLKKYEGIDYPLSDNPSQAQQVSQPNGGLRADQLVVIDDYIKQQKQHQKLTEPSQDYFIGSVPLPMKIEDQYSHNDEESIELRMESRHIEESADPKVIRIKQRQAQQDSLNRRELVADQEQDQAHEYFQNYLAGQLPAKKGRAQFNLNGGSNQVFTSRGEPTFRPSTKGGNLTCLTSARGPSNLRDESTLSSQGNKNRKKPKVSDRLKEHKEKIRALALAALELKNSQQEHFKQIYLRAKNKRISDYFTDPTPSIALPAYAQNTNPTTDPNWFNKILSYGGGAIVESPRDQLSVIPESALLNKQRMYSNQDLLKPHPKTLPRDPRLEVGYISSTQQGTRPKKYFNNQLNEFLQQQPSLEVLSAVFRDSRTPFSDEGLSRPWSIPSNQLGQIELKPVKDQKSNRYTPQPMYVHDNHQEAPHTNFSNIPPNPNRTRILAQRQKYQANSKYSKDLLEEARQSLLKQKQQHIIPTANGLPVGDFISIPINPLSELSSFDNQNRPKITPSPRQAREKKQTSRTPGVGTNKPLTLHERQVTTVQPGRAQSIDVTSSTIPKNKWNQVVTYMQKNPKVLMQVLNMIDQSPRDLQESTIQSPELLDKGQTRVKIQERKRLAGAGSKLSPRGPTNASNHDKQLTRPAQRISNQKAKSQLDKHTDDNKKQREDDERRFKSLEKSAGVGSIGSGVKGSIVQSPTNGDTQKSQRSTMQNIGEYLKNWSSNNFRRKHSIIPGQSQVAEPKTQMSLYETFLNRKQLVKQNHSNTTTSPNRTTVLGQTKSPIQLFSQAGKIESNTTTSYTSRLESHSKPQVPQIRIKTNQATNSLGFKQRYSMPPPPQRLDGTSSSLDSTSRDVSQPLEAHLPQKVQQQAMPVMETPVFSADHKPNMKIKIAEEGGQHHNEEEFDDGFIYEDNELGSEMSATFLRNDLTQQVRKHQQETVDDMVEMDTVRSQNQRDQNPPSIPAIETLVSPHQGQNRSAEQQQLNLESPINLQKFEGTPFVSRPNLQGLNSVIVQEAETEQHLSELDRVKRELEKKDHELREAKRALEELKSHAPNIIMIQGEESKNSPKRPTNFVEKVYYETPRSTAAGINDELEEAKLGDDMRERGKQANDNIQEVIDEEVKQGTQEIEEEVKEEAPRSKPEDRSSSQVTQTFIFPSSELDELSSQQASNLSSKIGLKKQTQVLDWHVSHLMQDAQANRLNFNSKGDPMFYSESDIDYTLQMFDAQYKNLHRAKLLEPYHQKATTTLVALFQDLNLPQIEQVVHTLSEVNVASILKLLHKCKQLMEARRLIVGVMRDLELHEGLVRDIRSIADQQLSESVDTDTLERIKKLAMKLVTLTTQIKQTLVHLRDDLKLFSRIAALTTRSKSLVSNLFIYKKRDALKYALKEYEAIRQLMNVFFDATREMPYISAGQVATPSQVVQMKQQSRARIGREEVAKVKKSRSEIRSI